MVNTRGCGIEHGSLITVYHRWQLRRCGRGTTKENIGDSDIIGGRIDPDRAAMEGGLITAPSWAGVFRTAEGRRGRWKLNEVGSFRSKAATVLQVPVRLKLGFSSIQR